MSNSLPPKKRSRERIFEKPLEAVKVLIRPDGKGLLLEVFADYDPIQIPLASEEAPEIQGSDEVGELKYIAGREMDIEENARVFLFNSFPLVPTKDAHIFRVHDDDLYLFAKDILPELEYRFSVTISSEAEARLTIRRGSLSSMLNVRETGSGWFDFSIDWQAKNAKINPEEVREALESGRPYIRDASGAFVEVANTDEVEQLAYFLSQAERQEDGTYRSKLYSAPELAAMLERTESQRFAKTDELFEAFLDAAKAGKPIRPVEFPAHLDTVLRPYQKQGVAWLMFLREHGFGGILADDMGLGKTLQILAFLSLTREPKKPVIVICPKTLLITWADEAARFTPELKKLVIDGTQDERRALIKKASDYDLIITSYSTIQRDIKSYIKLGSLFRACILDEAQFVKNPSTATAKAVKLLPTELRIALTGTPLENGVHELWSIFDFLMPGFLGDRRFFRGRYERPIMERRDSEVLDRLRIKVRPFMLRRTKESELQDLPPKIEDIYHCSLTPEQLVVYARTLEKVREDVTRAVEEKGFNRARIEILTALMKLRRICDHPALVDPRLPRSEELSGKLDYSLELVRQAKESGHKLLLFSQFTTMLDIIRETFDKHGIGHCTIEGRTRDREAEIKRFCNDSSVTVFLLSLRAGGTGLTLTEADMVILFDPWWNPMVERQAMDRAHRIGQSKTVNVYKLVTKGTVEEKVVALQERKSQLFDALMQENPDLAEALTWEDVKTLFE